MKVARHGLLVVGATGQAGLDEERAELAAVEADPGRLLGDLGATDVDRRGVLKQLLFHAVAVEAGDHDQLQCDRRRSQAAGFELAGVQLDVQPTDVGQRVEMMVATPAQPQPQLGATATDPGSWIIGGLNRSQLLEASEDRPYLLSSDGCGKNYAGESRTLVLDLHLVVLHVQPPLEPSVLEVFSLTA